MNDITLLCYIPCEEPVHETRKAETAIGLDFSMKELYVDSNGNHAAYPSFFQKARQKLARGSVD